MSTAIRKLLYPQSVGWRETAMLAVVAWLVPFLVHLVPWAGPRPLGVYVLPVFWTTFVAVYFYGAFVGLAIGLVTPLVNLALTGLPAAAAVGSMGLEVAFFVLAVALVTDRWPGFWFSAPLAWFAAKALAIGGLFLLTTSGSAEPLLAHLVRSTENGLAGLGVLTVINGLLVVFYPKTDAWEKE